MKFIIIWDAGYGDTAEVIDAENEAAAEKIAYESWREDAESNANYSAQPYSDELAENYGLEE